jgi:hypothetical protein
MDNHVSLPTLPSWLPPAMEIPRFFMPPDDIYVAHSDRFALMLHHLLASATDQSRRQAVAWFTGQLDEHPRFANYFRFWRSEPRDTCQDVSMNNNLKVFDAFMLQMRESLRGDQPEMAREAARDAELKKQRIDLVSFVVGMIQDEDPAIRQQNAVDLQTQMLEDSSFLGLVEEAISAPFEVVPGGMNMAGFAHTIVTLEFMVRFAKGALSPRSLEKYHKLGVFGGAPLGVENWTDAAAGDWEQAGAREGTDARTAKCEQTAVKKTAEARAERWTDAASAMRAEAAGAATSAPRASGLQEEMLATQLDESLRYGLNASPVRYNRSGEMGDVSYIDDFE